VRERRSEEDRLALAQSVKQSGILVALLGHCEDSDIVLDDGYGRLDAAAAAGLETVPMVVSDHAPTPAELITLQLVVNTLRSDLTVMEKSRALARLMQETGWSAAQVSVKLGKPSPASISKLLALQVHPREVQDLIDAGRIPMSSAYFIATVADAAERERLIREVLDGRLTRDRLVAQTKVVKAGRSAAPPRKPRQVVRERVSIPLGEGRSVSVSAPTLSVESLIAWFADLAERIRTAGADGRPLAEVIRAISGNGK
jgi:ParB/RepB/Spo0J family partition protein